MKKQKIPTPTEEQFSALNGAYDYFNRTLFFGSLPGCILIFSRRADAHGYMSPNRWRKVKEKQPQTHEIALTYVTLYREPLKVFSTLVHEMCHLWQFEYGNPSRGGYHNKEWAQKMLSIGLIPSHTGAPGGNQTGQKMTHYIERGGEYEKAFEKMPESFLLPFTTVDSDIMALVGSLPTGTKPLKVKNKTKYTCLSCDTNIWGRPGLSVICGDCNKQYIEK